MVGLALAGICFVAIFALLRLVEGAGVITPLQEKQVKLKMKKEEIDVILGAEDITAEDEARVKLLADERDKLVTEIKDMQEAVSRLDTLRKENAEAITAPPQIPAAGAPEGPVVSKVHANAEDDMLRGYKTPRAFIMDVLTACRGGAMTELLKPLKVSATAGSDEHGLYSDPYGNFAVPPGMSPDLLKTTAEGDVLGQFVRRVPMSVAVLQFLARVDKTHTNSVSGGFRWYWGSEADTVASSRSELEKITLTAHTAKGIAYATNELLNDSPLTFAAMIADGFAEEYASFITEARLTGTGVGQLTGIRNSGAIIEITKENGQAASTVLTANILKMMARCWGFSKAVWVANPTLIPQLGVLTIDNGASVVPMFLPSLRDGMPMTLMGRPIIYSEHAKALGTAGDLSLYNMGEYLEGTLQNLQGQSSIHVRFLENESCFRFTARKAGAPWWRGTLTPKNGDTVSPFVQLGAR